MIGVKLMISNGHDTDTYRDRAQDVIARLQHMFLYQMTNANLYLSEWDYRRDPSMVLPAGGIATRSLAMVDSSEGLIAILGPTVPRVTSKEIRRACQRIRDRERVEMWTFVNPDQITPSHDRFFARIKKDFGQEIVWSRYHNELEFQAMLFTTLVPYLAGRAGAHFPGVVT